MKKLFFIGLLILANSFELNAQIFSQNPFNDQYQPLIKLAVKSYQEKAYVESAQYYSKAFTSNGNKGMTNDRFAAAASWAMAGNKDSAFVQLQMISSARYSKYNALMLDLGFESLKDDQRWKEVVNKIKTNRLTYNPYLNLSLVEHLDTILQDDQKYRNLQETIKTTYGENSKEIKELYTTIQYVDSINLIKVRLILDQYGWPSYESIGDEGQTALFLVIQHADLKMQENYLPQIESAVQMRAIPASYLALLEDRMAISKGMKQIYGTQIGTDKVTGKFFLEPLIDPANVDKRRKEKGLGPLADYLKEWGIE